jgi:peptide/nickel transport system substrate-binding protein
MSRIKALSVSRAGTVSPAGGATPTRRDVLVATAAGVLAAGAPHLAGAAPKLGGIINMHSYSFPPPNWHPHVTNTVQVMSYSGIYNQLIEYNPETEDPFDLRGDLATSWELGKDGKAYTFHLDPQARWHDGKPVTAVDVVYSMDSMVDADAKPPRVVTLPALSPYYEKGTARAIDAHTVEIPLKIPFAPDFLRTLALDFCKIIAKHWGESGVDLQKWENAMGSGPFKPGKFVKDVSIELVKNKDYWKPELPRIDGMVHYTIKDKGTAIAAYKTERVLMTNWGVNNLSNKEAVQLEKEAKDKLRIEYIRNAGFFFFFMNTSRKPFDNPKVRQAVNLALDRHALLKTFGVPGLDTLGPPLGVGTWFGRTAAEIGELPGWRQLDGEKHPDDIAKAKALLAEAGYPNGFKAEMMIRQVVEFPDHAVVYKEQLKKIGIEATLKLEDSATGFQRYLKGDWVMAPQGSAHFITEPDAVLGRVWMPNGTWARYARSVPPKWWQEAYAGQAGESSRDKRKSILRKMEDYLIFEDPGGCAVTYWTARNWIMNKKIKGIHASGSLWAGYKHETDWLSAEA